MKGRQVSVNDEREGSEDAAAFNNATQEETEQTMLTETIAEGAVDAVSTTSAINLLEPTTDVNGESESQTTSFSAIEEAKQVFGEVEPSQDSQLDDKMNPETEGEHGALTQSQRENTPQSSLSQREEAATTTVAQLSLPPWQDDFNFEDVFKPVPTRGQRSVRRSLRNKSSVDPSGCEGGMAWLPHTSPETIKESRRRTRGRRLSAALVALSSDDIQL